MDVMINVTNIVVGILSIVCAIFCSIKSYEAKCYYENCKIIDAKLMQLKFENHGFSHNTFGDNVHNLTISA